MPGAYQIASSDEGLAVITRNMAGEPRFVAFDREGRIFNRSLPATLDDFSGVSLVNGGETFGKFFESPADTRRFYFERFYLSDSVGGAEAIDHLVANDYAWAFAGNDHGWVMAVYRFPDRITVHRLGADGAYLGATQLTATAPMPAILEWTAIEMSADTILVSYPMQRGGAPAAVWLLSMDGGLVTEKPLSIPLAPIRNAITGDGQGKFYYLAGGLFGNRLYRISSQGIELERVIDFDRLSNLKWLHDKLWALDTSRNTLFGLDDDGARREGPISLMPPGWDESPEWLDMRVSGGDLGFFFTDGFERDNVHYMRLEAGPLVTPTPTPGSGIPTGASVTIEIAAGIPLQMAQIPRGSYQRGSDETDPDARPNESPQHNVTLTRDFFISRHLITNEQYRLFDPNHQSPVMAGHSLNGATQPVVNVSWYEAKAFCDWLSEKTDYRFSLPSEAEWEYVCRAGTQTRRPWGDDLSNDLACAYANVADIQAADFDFPMGFDCDDGFAATSPVGSYPPNAFGVYDMLGNVWEWTEDWFSSYRIESQVDPVGPERGYSKIIRGGSWQDGPIYVRSAVRTVFSPDNGYSALGFRVVIRE